jgi:hypothetical protein
MSIALETMSRAVEFPDTLCIFHIEKPQRMRSIQRLRPRGRMEKESLDIIQVPGSR